MGSTDLLAATIAALPIPTVALDPDGVVLAVNGPADAAFGCAGDAAGRPFAALAASRRIPGIAAAVERARRGVLPEPFEAVDAAGRAVRCRVDLVRSDETDVLLLTAEDCEEIAVLRARLHQVEGELRASRSETVEISRHKDDFLAMLAHELRNPLAPILSAVQVMRRHPHNEAVVDRAREIVERQVRHQAQLLDDLLDVSRITRGRIQLRRAPVDLRSAVSDAVDATRSLIDARGHTLTVTLPDTPLPLEADPTRLTQIITNLIDNAAKYTSPGGQIEVTARGADGGIVLHVRDTGIGIPADMQDRVFELFTQVDAPIARSLGGLGLGLTLVRRLTELHGGTVAVASEGPGRGSEFTVRLPIGRAEPAPEASTPGAPGARHILVIDDNADAREMLRIALELEGHRVDTAEDGARGVAVALQTAPDVVLVDIGLPGLDGYDVARRLRATLGTRVTLVALTGYGASEDRRRTREAGFDAHLVKPVDPGTLSRALSGDFGAAA